VFPFPRSLFSCYLLAFLEACCAYDGLSLVLLDRTSRTINIVLNSTLFLVGLICNLLLILIFLSPGAFHLDSPVHPRSRSFRPAVIVALATAISTASTPALMTGVVEHSVWLRLAPGSSRKNIRHRRKLSSRAVVCVAYRRTMVYYNGPGLDPQV
jgi:hypothetical protein